MKAKVKNDTLFKLQPVLSSDLTDAEKVFVPGGSEYELKFFLLRLIAVICVWNWPTPPLPKIKDLPGTSRSLMWMSKATASR